MIEGTVKFRDGKKVSRYEFNNYRLLVREFSANLKDTKVMRTFVSNRKLTNELYSTNSLEPVQKRTGEKLQRLVA